MLDISHSFLFAIQDSFQEHYSQTGRYPGPIMSPSRRPWALINWLFWSCLLLYPLGLLLAQLISSGSVLTIFASVAFCSAGWFHAFMPDPKPPWRRYRGLSFSLTSSFLSKRFIKQQIWQVQCKSPFSENPVCQSWEHVPNSFQACACLANVSVHLNAEMLVGEVISLTAWIHKEHVTVSTINKLPCLWLTQMYCNNRKS